MTKLTGRYPTLSLALYLGTFSLCSWYFESIYNLETQNKVLTYYLILYSLLGVLYLINFHRCDVRVYWKRIAGLLLAINIATPSTLQTDQLRYIWDGIEGARGNNPYLNIPWSAYKKENVFWMEQINNKRLRTVYPPVAETLFAASTFFNPFLWNQAFGLDLPAAKNYWQVELGWKIMVGLFCVFLVYLLRHKSIIPLVSHPLFLTTIYGNAHIDIVFGVFLLASLSWVGKEKFKTTLFFAGSILSKWIPLIFAPFFLLAWKRRWGLRATWLATALLMGTHIVLIGAYFWEAEGKMFSSLETYLQHWHFFGYIHAIVMAGISIAIPSLHGALIAKKVVALLYFFWGAGCGWLFFRKKISLRLSLLLAYLGFLIFNPTLHPWYFLTLLIISFPYRAVLPSLWLWPFFAQFSSVFYFEMKPVITVQVLVYLLVTVLLIKDLGKLKGHLTRSPLQIPKS